MEKFIGQVVDSAVHWLPALIGGFVDYCHQVQKGEKKWSIYGFCLHLLSAVFFGWITGIAIGDFGYNDGVIAASAGIGGFLGVRVADLITYKFMGIDQRKD